MSKFGEKTLAYYTSLRNIWNISEKPPSISDEDIYAETRKDIKNLLFREQSSLPSIAIFELSKIIEVAVHLGEASKLDWILLNEIREATHDFSYFPLLNDIHSWNQALGFAVTSLNNNHHRSEFSYGTRQFLVASALKRLKAKGFPYSYARNGFCLPEKQIGRVCARIEKKIILVGGIEAASRLLQLMQRLGRYHDGSFLHARSTKQVFSMKQNAGTPWNYLYSICVKHMEKTPKTTNITPALEEMEKLAIGLAASFDVEMHSSYEQMDIGTYSVIFALNETLVCDELFAIPQWQPKASKFLVLSWLTFLEDCS